MDVTLYRGDGEVGARSIAVAGSRDRFAATLRRLLEICGMTLAILISALAVLAFSCSFELSQAQTPEENGAHARHHPPEDMPIHEKFYSTWMMPDRPTSSCCNNRDCYPTEVRFRDGFWEAKRREDGAYVRIPWEKVERNRDNPDGRSHVCMPPPSSYRSDGGEVFCFSLGGGT